MKPVFIYCLKDPATGEIRYIRKTNALKKRLSAHIRESRKRKNHLGYWLRSLGGKAPILVVLHRVLRDESWQEEERRYIAAARAIGVNLVNATDGGEGGLGCVPSLETRAAMSASKKGVRLSPEHCAAMSAVRMGHPVSPETRAAISAKLTGIPQSPEARAINSISKKGLPKSLQHRAAMSAVRIGVPHPQKSHAAAYGRSRLDKANPLK